MALEQIHSRELNTTHDSVTHMNFTPASILWNGMHKEELKMMVVNFSHAVTCTNMANSSNLLQEEYTTLLKESIQGIKNNSMINFGKR